MSTRSSDAGGIITNPVGALIGIVFGFLAGAAGWWAEGFLASALVALSVAGLGAALMRWGTGGAYRASGLRTWKDPEMTESLLLCAGHGGEGMNPLIPTSWEVLALLIGAAVIVVFVVAVLSLARDEYYTATQRLLWLLVLLAAPVVGPLLWLSLGRHHVFKSRSGPAR